MSKKLMNTGMNMSDAYIGDLINEKNKSGDQYNGGTLEQGVQ